jgi:hypothetical protein
MFPDVKLEAFTFGTRDDYLAWAHVILSNGEYYETPGGSIAGDFYENL